MNTPSHLPDPNRPTCPGCGAKVDMHTTVGMGDVRGKFAVTGRCPYTKPRPEGGTQGCRYPTALVFDRYGMQYVFAPSFESLNHRLHELGAGPAVVRIAPPPSTKRRKYASS